MALEPGTRLGPYEITAKLGAGGMGEVYRARDMALNREVAIKVMPDALADDPDRLARFQREAEALAALNHPNIAQVYGLEKSGAAPAIVMELVEGEDLSGHIVRGAMPIDDALPIARQIAEALEAAHEAGVIHRDLKPANIKVREDGTVKVLDFGLAKAMAPDSGPGTQGPSNSPTMTSPAMTEIGMILGTAAYMSPEQARGKTVDRRADIWAFGVVLFEMLAGRKLFDGDDMSVTLANVIKSDPDWSALPADLPRSLHRLLRRCLEKDPRKRLSAIGDARFDLEDLDEPSGESAPAATPSRTRERVLWAAGLAAVTVIAVLGGRWLGDDRAETVLNRFEFTLPELALNDEATRPEISPDGRQVALVSLGSGGLRRVWVRSAGAVEFQPLEGTEGASYPFWSPDSRSLGFFAGDELKRIAVAGGPAETLSVAIRARGGAWSSTGVILFSATVGADERLRQLAEGGGTATDVGLSMDFPAGSRVRWPHFLPDGRRFLFFGLTREQDSEGIYLGSLDDPGVSMLADAFSEARYADGHLLFVRDNILVAQPFDAARGEMGLGDPISVADGVRLGGNEGAFAFSVSETGTLVSVPLGPPPSYQLRWFDRGGRIVGDLGPPAPQAAPRISPDGLRVATFRSDRTDTTSGGEIWVSGINEGRPARLTFDDASYGWPIWSSDGNSIIYGKATRARGLADLYRVAARGDSTEELVWEGDGHSRPLDASADGRFLIFRSQLSQSALDLTLLPLQPSDDRTPVPYLANGFAQGRARLSPDGMWLAYQGNETGSFEVYVQSFPTPGNKTLISTGGGALPVWSRDGSEIFYQSGRTLMAAPVSTAGGVLVVEASTAVFDLPVTGAQSQVEYDVAPDGRFLLNIPLSDRQLSAVVTLNWTAAVNR